MGRRIHKEYLPQPTPETHPFVCPECSRRFTTKHGLSIHRSVTHDVRKPIITLPIKCTLCPEMITKLGRQTDSLYRAIVDGEKKSFHWGCYFSVYNPSKDPDVHAKISKTQKERWANMSEERMTELSVIWSKAQKERWDTMSEEKRTEFGDIMSKAGIEYWANISEEDKVKRTANGIRTLAINQKPNISEKRINEIISPIGFQMNVVGGKMVGGRIPDFIHNHEQRVIEYDGEGGHSPLSMWTSDTWEECLVKDDKRDQNYRDAGYCVLRIFPEDLAEGDDFVRAKVEEWMYSG